MPRKLVQNQDDLQTLRFLIDWGGARIRAGLAIGGVVNGEAVLTDVGMMCLDQWMKGHPSQTVVFAEFKKVATGNLENLRRRIIEQLDSMKNHGDNAVLMFVAKNPTMYDKIGALIGLHHPPKD